MDLQVREPPFKGNTWESRPVGGVGSQSNSGNDYSSQRHSSRRGNYGSRPRGDGMHYNGHGGRRDQDRNWNAPRNSTARDVHMHQIAPPPPPPPRFMRPGLPGSTPFIPLPHVYGNPMPFGKLLISGKLKICSPQYRTNIINVMQNLFVHFCMVLHCHQNR